MVHRQQHCLFCGVGFSAAPETAQASKEHIFPAGIGGIWVSDGLICRACNSQIGHRLDHHLSALFRPLIALLGIRHGREKHVLDFEFEQDGKTHLLHAERGELLTFDLDRPTLTAPGQMEMSVRPGAEQQVKRSMEGYARKTLGWDTAALGAPKTYKISSPAKPVPFTVDLAAFDRDEVAAAVGKIAFLGTAELLGPEWFAELEVDALRQSILTSVGLGQVTFPEGAKMLSRYGHGLTLHRLDDGWLGALVTLFGACSVIVRIAPIPDSWPDGSFPGKINLPVEEQLLDVLSPPMSLGATNVGQTIAGLDRLNAEMEPHVMRQAAIRRAWTAAGLPGRLGSVQLTEDQNQRFLECQRHEFQLMGIN